MSKPSKLRLAVLTALAGYTSMPVHAADDDLMLDEVIVTAQQVKEDVQKVAVSMEVMSAEELNAAGVASVAEVAKFTPGLQLDQVGGGLTATVRIRGIGTPGFSALDPSVPIFIDGVAQARTGAGFQDLLDISRIEVLRGPQGTLYGRNSTAGAINVWTKDANTKDWEGSAEVQKGNYELTSLKGTLNIPIVDDILAARISAYSVDQDGYVTNGYTGQTGNGFADRNGARAKIGFTPTSNVNVQWVTDYSKSTTHPLSATDKIPTQYNVYAAGTSDHPDPTGNGGPHFTSVGIYTHPNLTGIPLNSFGMPIDDAYNGKVYRNVDAFAIDTNFATSLTLNWEITDSATFTSISAYSRYKTNNFLDQDASILDFGLLASSFTKTFSRSQEFRLLGTIGDHVDYITGAYYSDDVVDSRNVTDNLRQDAIDSLYYRVPDEQRGGSNSVYAYSVTALDSDARALFGQLTYKIGKFNLTGGVRANWSKKFGNTDLFFGNYIEDPDSGFPLGPVLNPDGTVSIAPYQVCTPLPCVPKPIIDHVTTRETETSGVFKVKYFATDDTLLYASYDTGYKAGGFNRKISINGGGIPDTFGRELSTNYELGIKSSWLERRLQTNLSVFYLNFDGFHLQTQTADGDISVENLAKVVSKGLEADIQAVIVEGLTTGVGFAYLDPRVKDPLNKNVPRTGPGPCPTAFSSDQPVNNGCSSVYLKDQRLVEVSQRSVNVNADYKHALGGGGAEGFIRIDWAWRSEYGICEPRFVPRYAHCTQNPYSLTNVRFGVSHLADHWQLTAWSKNVLNKEYAVSGSAFFGGSGNGLNPYDGHFLIQGPPRTFGLTAQYDF